MELNLKNKFEQKETQKSKYQSYQFRGEST